MFKAFLNPIVSLINLSQNWKVSKVALVHNEAKMSKLTVPASVPVALTAALQHGIGTVAQHARGALDLLHNDHGSVNDP